LIEGRNKGGEDMIMSRRLVDFLTDN